MTISFAAIQNRFKDFSNITNNPSLIKRHRISALHLAVLNENITDIQSLLTETPQMMYAEDSAGLTPIHYALCAKKNTDILYLFINHSVFIANKPYRENNTLLHIACQMTENSQEIINIFIKLGMDVNAENEEGETPLILACQTGATLAVQILLEHQAKPDSITKDGKTALSRAKYFNHEKIIELLKGEKIDYTKQLWDAIATGDVKKVKEACENQSQIDFNYNGTDEDNFLHHACKGNEAPIVEFLLSIPGYSELLSHPDKYKKLPFEYCTALETQIFVLNAAMKVNADVPDLSDKQNIVAKRSLGDDTDSEVKTSLEGATKKQNTNKI